MYQELNGIKQDSDMGYVYVLYNPESELVKIGKTIQPQVRFRTLSNSNGSKFRYYLSDPIFINSLLEKVMHNRFHKYRVRGEWYKGIEFDTVVNELKKICNSEDFKRRNFKR